MYVYVYKSFRLAFLFFLLVSSFSSAYAKDSAIIIFDGSGSMWGQIDGKHKIEIAREVMGTLVKDWNEDIDLGLMAYGHRKKGSCSDIEMLFPVGTPDSKKILKIINKLSPKGKTPISQSLRQAAEKLRYTEDPATVILISDGEESCNADPCVVSRELEEKGINFTTHVIGFGVKKNKEALKQLQCIAKNTGGQFYEAEDASELSEAIKQVQKEVEDPRPTLCKAYAEEAVKQKRTSIEKECGYTGEHWHDDFDKHYEWCVGQSIGSELPNNELLKRTASLKKCEVVKPKEPSNGGTGKLVFNWPGSNYWQIFQGGKNVGNTSKENEMYSGKSQQALPSGTYTIKSVPNSFGNTVFDSFDVTIKKGETVTIDKGGVLKLNWAGRDAWQIFKSGKNVGNGNYDGEVYKGSSSQALQAGIYTIQPSRGATFESFDVVIKKGEVLVLDK